MGHDGIAPLRLLQIGREQLSAYPDVEYLPSAVSVAAQSGNGFGVAAGARQAWAPMLLLATRVVDEPPKIPGLMDLYGTSVHVCPYCDGWEHRDGQVAVYGRGDKGVELARLLRQWTVDLVLCSDGPAQIEAAQRLSLHKAGIAIREDTIASLEGSAGRLERIVFDRGPDLPRSGLFFTTGQHTRSPLPAALGCAFDDKGGLVCEEDGATSVPGIYVDGDASRDVQLAINKALFNYSTC